MKYKAAIFDLDGTILDTLTDLTNCTNYALETNGYCTRTMDEVKSFVGNGIGLLIKRALPAGVSDEIIEKTLSDFKAYYIAHTLDNTKPYEGIPELLKLLKAEGVKLGVVSNKTDKAVKPLVDHFFYDIFDEAIGERDNVRRKPAPDTVLEVMKSFGVSPRETVYIGDSDVDIETAKNAGVDVISVTWGFRDEEFLKKNGAEILIHNVSELAPLII